MRREGDVEKCALYQTAAAFACLKPHQMRCEGNITRR